MRSFWALACKLLEEFRRGFFFFFFLGGGGGGCKCHLFFFNNKLRSAINSSFILHICIWQHSLDSRLCAPQWTTLVRSFKKHNGFKHPHILARTSTYRCPLPCLELILYHIPPSLWLTRSTLKHWPSHLKLTQIFGNRQTSKKNVKYHYYHLGNNSIYKISCNILISVYFCLIVFSVST